MGVVRREGDWRLEKREEGVYEITYQRNTQAKVLTPKYDSRGIGAPMLDVMSVREVGSYSEAEGLFEEMAHGGPPIGAGPPGNGGASSTRVGFDDTVNLEGGDGGDFDVTDLPPGGLALALLATSAIFLRTTGFAPESTLFLFSVATAAAGVTIFGWAGVLWRTKGWAGAIKFLATVDKTSDRGSTEQSKRTPPTPEKLKNTLIFDRASQQCEWCEEKFDHPHVHHIQPRREGGPNEPRNLIVLCPNCHEKADREAIPRSKLKAKVRRQPSVSTP